MEIHDGRKIKDPNTPSKIILLRIFLKRNKKKIQKFFLFILILLILFFPVWSGNLIGNWIKDFIGTILNIIKTI